MTPANASISVAFVAPGQRRRQRDHRLHGNVHVERRRHRREQRRCDLADRRVGADQRQDLHLHRPRHQRASAAAASPSASASAVPATVPSAPAKPTDGRGRDARSRSPSWRRPTVAARSPATPRPARRATAAPPAATPARPRRSSVQSLTKSKSYTCTVHATNAIGELRRVAAHRTPPSFPRRCPTRPPSPRRRSATARSRSPSSPRTTAAARSPATARTARRVTAARRVRSRAAARRSWSPASTNGKTYTCTVLATNSVGDSDASVASDATVPATAPGTPAAPTVTARQRVDLGRVRRAREHGGSRNHGLHRELHVE